MIVIVAVEMLDERIKENNIMLRTPASPTIGLIYPLVLRINAASGPDCIYNRVIIMGYLYP